MEFGLLLEKLPQLVRRDTLNVCRSFDADDEREQRLLVLTRKKKRVAMQGASSHVMSMPPAVDVAVRFLQRASAARRRCNACRHEGPRGTARCRGASSHGLKTVETREGRCPLTRDEPVPAPRQKGGAVDSARGLVRDAVGAQARCHSRCGAQVPSASEQAQAPGRPDSSAEGSGRALGRSAGEPPPQRPPHRSARGRHPSRYRPRWVRTRQRHRHQLTAPDLSPNGQRDHRRVARMPARGHGHESGLRDPARDRPLRRHLRATAETSPDRLR